MRFGVEEEFFVVDPAGRDVVPRARAVVAHARKVLGSRIVGEDTELQVETRTRPCATAAELARQIGEGRSCLASAAAEHGLAIVASGTPVVGDAIPSPLPHGPRQEQGRASVRGLLHEYNLCAVHVHVEMPDRERAVLMSNHLRPHLPALIALTANSPYWAGRDTGYASWRTLLWSRWPVAGPPPHFRSAAHYARLIATLREAGALIDERTVYWDIRPSAHHPTLEIRAADIPMTAAESAAYAALVRALAVSLLPAVERGDPGPVLEPELMRLAYWRAARDGATGAGIDVRTGEVVPVTEVARRLLETARPGLEEHGDLDRVTGWLRRLGEIGDGARRQRSRRRGEAGRADLHAVVDHLIEETEKGAFA
ncbi:glutamate--cysteine ligase [Actinomadura viridis]|uniref:Putative glutamate--cysteine ligase 2 n=1 Tax=Actinomadura viridis TaxID=58110 RepID=A0A931GNT0_9ACTN|nr:glutamate--cysteine ligase [Actinomadura viridis]MBG6093260.1 carboxylate-amine ligase [Actinomadura viridis]